MKYCRKCGAELRDDDVFCPKCGTKVLEDEPQEKDESVVPVNQTNDSFETRAETVEKPKVEPKWQPPKKKKKHTVRNVILVIVALFVFLSCALGGGDSDDSKAGSSSNSVTHTITKGKLKSISAIYNGKTDAGVVVGNDLDDFTVKAKYSRGKSEKVTGFKVKKAKTLKAGQSVSVKITYEGKYCTVKVKCTTLTFAQYKAQCVSYAYKTVARQPSRYKGKKWHIYGQIVQVMDNDDGTYDLRIATDNDGYGDYYDDVVYVRYKPAKGVDKLLEDDKVNAYGECRGEISYESTFGQKITIPAMRAEYIIRS